MENMMQREVSMGGRLYSLRMARRMSQEQLAAVLCISPAAVSKWERNLSRPSIEMLWALADLFECSIDELVGRTRAQVERIAPYDEKTFRLALIGEDLLKCSEISRAEGLLAMESYVPKLRGGSRFLAFAIPYVLNLYAAKLGSGPEEPFQFLENYAATLTDAERPEGRMITAALRKIFSGESPEILRELIASHIGMDYGKQSGKMGEMLRHTRQEILDSYKDKGARSERTNLLEAFAHMGDLELQLILRDTDSTTLTAALAGASGRVVQVFLANLSDRLLYFIHEDIRQWKGTEEEILTAQNKLLELGKLYGKPAED